MTIASNQHAGPQAQRVLLLVDDELNILTALNRLLRQDRYTILTATSGKEALERLAAARVDVIVSDQRMPGMTGVEFLRIAKELYPDTIRIVLSGYTELESVTSAINEGAIYKFLTKPWDDEQLRQQVAEAFKRKELMDENIRLNKALQVVNGELSRTNIELDHLLQQRELQIESDEISLDVLHEVLQHLPLPVIGIDEDELVVFVNAAGQAVAATQGLLLGQQIRHLMPLLPTRIDVDAVRMEMTLNGALFEVSVHAMGNKSRSRGHLLTLTHKEAGRSS